MNAAMPSITRLRRIHENLWCSGQPSPEQLQALPAAGIRTVISLCPDGECGWDERALAATLGLQHCSIPIRGAGDLGTDAAERLAAALRDASGPVLLHCASANRVGALMAIKAYHLDGCDSETALQQGRAAGLSALEGVVAGLFGR